MAAVAERPTSQAATGERLEATALVESAREITAGDPIPPIHDLTDALRAIAARGDADDYAGDRRRAPRVRVARVDRFLLWTDPDGTQEADPYPTAFRAMVAMNSVVASWGGWR